MVKFFFFSFPTGKPEPLVYYIPQHYFNALQARLSLGSKRRLPNFTTGGDHTVCQANR